MPATPVDNSGHFVRLSTNPTAVTKRAGQDVYAFEFPDSDTPDYGLLTASNTFFTRRGFSLENLEILQHKEVPGTADTLKYGFFVTMIANGESKLGAIADFGAFGRSVVEHEAETYVWYFVRVKGTLTHHIITFMPNRAAADLHLAGDIPKQFGAQVGGVFGVEPVLENTNALAAFY